MRFDGILEFLGHHQLSKKPAGVPMGAVAIHGILIGELVPGSACIGFLYDQFSEAVDLRRGKRRADVCAA